MNHKHLMIAGAVIVAAGAAYYFLVYKKQSNFSNAIGGGQRPLVKEPASVTNFHR